MRNLRWENKKQEAGHVRQIKTSKLEVRSFPQSGRLEAQGCDLGECAMVWKSPRWDGDREPRRQDYKESHSAGWLPCAAHCIWSSKVPAYSKEGRDRPHLFLLFLCLGKTDVKRKQ